MSKNQLGLGTVLVIVISLTSLSGCNTKSVNLSSATARSTPMRSNSRELSTATKAAAAMPVTSFSLETASAPQPLAEGVYVDEEHAWVLLGFSDLRRTVDGGRTWQRLRPPREPVPVDISEMYKASFVTPKRGWLKTNSGTWQTDDGGLTWRRIFAGSAIPQFADERHGWMSLYNESDETAQSYVTENGGQAWRPCGFKLSWDEQVPRNVYFLTPKIGWAITSQSDENRRTQYGVARTADGGCHWEQLLVSDNSGVWYGGIYFLNESSGWLIGGDSLYHTADGGKTWQEVPSPVEGVELASVHFTDADNGWVIAAPKTIDDTGMYRTNDGGKSWKQLTVEEITGPQHGEIPAKWEVGKLLQMLYNSGHSN